MRVAHAAVAVLSVLALLPPAADAQATPVPPPSSDDEVQRLVDPVLTRPDLRLEDAQATAAQVRARLEPVGPSFVPYQAGAPVASPSRHPHAVAVLPAVLAFSMADGSLQWVERLGLCSGTVVEPTLVITAGHCVEDLVGTFLLEDGIEYVFTYLVVQGVANVHGAWPSATQLGIAVDAAPLGGYTGAIPAFDVGLVLLDPTTPIDLLSYPLVEGLQVPFSPDDLDLTRRGALVLASFGSSTGAVDPVGKLQVGKYVAVPDQQCVDAFAMDPLHLLCTRGVAPTVDACQGDSGGGFIQERFGRKVLVAVVSGGHEECHLAHPGAATRLGQAFADAFADPVEPVAGGFIDFGSGGFEGWVAGDGVRTSAGVFFAVGAVTLASPVASFWRPGWGMASGAVRLAPDGLLLDARAIVPGEPFLAEVLVAGRDGPGILQVEGVLPVVRPVLDVAFTRDAAGTPVLEGTLSAEGGAGLPGHPLQATFMVGDTARRLAATTRADGGFTLRLNGVPAGTHDITFSGKFVATTLVAAFQEARPIEVIARAPAIEATQGRDAMGRPILAGRVLDQDLMPIGRLRVTATFEVAGVAKAVSATTTADGSFVLRLAGIPAGEYDAVFRTAADPRMLIAPLSVDGHVSLVTRLPSTGLVVSKDAAGGTVLTGRLLDQSGDPVAKLPVQATMQVGGTAKRILATTAADGTFTLKVGIVPAGDYVVTLTSLGNAAALVGAMDLGVPVTVT